ncbi:MAG: hypothetical protein U0103_30105 [Candidatus Obscuribacterales bacterium]
MSAFEAWNKPTPAHRDNLIQVAENENPISQVIADTWTQCPDGTAARIAPWQTRAEVCGDQK